MNLRNILPPHIFLGSILLMWGLHGLFPFFQWLPSGVRVLGIFFVIDGLLSVSWASYVVKKHQTVIHPFGDASELLTIGPYRMTRNPMYLGLTTMLVGVALVLGSVLLLPFPFLFAFLIQKNYIMFEEQNLERLFGQEYLEYKDTVRRWI